MYNAKAHLKIMLFKNLLAEQWMQSSLGLHLKQGTERAVCIRRTACRHSALCCFVSACGNLQNTMLPIRELLKTCRLVVSHPTIPHCFGPSPDLTNSIFLTRPWRRAWRLISVMHRHRNLQIQMQLSRIICSTLLNGRLFRHLETVTPIAILRGQLE